ncbi:MAG TPA: NUDIX hydrolase [Nocardioides sp.]|uniref:NUDIX hydrolase n=1 Tax=Nocardioides sp. TaxID=35761 RepID=UPI002E342AC2|nr:NUDIX hydrolase [Nocardioides sp.]HEX3932324.1 NUDIX hydrolase [Nocardioides sp.]
MPATSRLAQVRAAGAVVLRKGHVLLVHRPAYDDWSFPKGKLDPGESSPAAALREVVEETGVRVRLGVPLTTQTYPNGLRTKVVEYWVGRVSGDHDVSAYAVNDEIDEVDWVEVGKAEQQLTYLRDHHTLSEALATGRKTRVLVVLRHGQARARKSWRKDDRIRPLLVRGMAQARAAAPVLEAFGVSRIVTSSSTRCLQTVAPYAELGGRPVESTDRLSEEHATARSVQRVVAEILDGGADAVLCTHRPVLPAVYDAVGIPPEQHATGELVVIHHRRGRVRALERHLG